MSGRVLIFDTTLRDGEQSPGASMNPEEKLRLAHKLDVLGVDVLEAGFPSVSPGDFEAVRNIARQMPRPIICALARIKDEEVHRAWEALKHAERPRLHVSIPTSDIHLKHRLHMNRGQVLEEVKRGVSLARRLCPDVQFSAEDASRADPGFLCQVAEAALASGASTINIADTVGYALPAEFGALITFLREQVPGLDQAMLGVHCHNDLGLATANTLAGLAAGARQAEVCVNGIGERAGNASLEEVVMAISTRHADLGLTTGVKTQEIYSASRLVSIITGLVVQPNKAVVGSNAFAHESGLHVDGVLKEPATYRIMSPEEIGLGRATLVLGKHSGRAALKARLKEMGQKLGEDDFEKLFLAFKALADKKKEIYDEDLEALIADEILRIPLRWGLEYLNVVSGTMAVPTATVRIIDGDKVHQEFGSGVGPVDAVYKTIAKITKTQAKLQNFSIASVTGGLDALGEVTLRLKEGENLVLGKGSDPDIMVAAAKAYLNGLNRLEYIKKNNSLPKNAD